MNVKIFLLLLLSGFTIAARCAPPTEEGKAIFTSRCAACHNINKVLTGPALAGVDQRHSTEWIVRFVHSSQSLVQSGDTAAVALFERFNKIVMPDHPDLSAEHIHHIIDYIKAEAATAADTKAPFVKPASLRPGYRPLPLSDPFFVGYIAIVGLLVAVLLFAVQLKQYERSREAR